MGLLDELLGPDASAVVAAKQRLVEEGNDALGGHHKGGVREIREVFLAFEDSRNRVAEFDSVLECGKLAPDHARHSHLQRCLDDRARKRSNAGAPPSLAGPQDISVTKLWTSRDLTRDIAMTLYIYPQPVLKPQLEHV